MKAIHEYLESFQPSCIQRVRSFYTSRFGKPSSLNKAESRFFRGLRSANAEQWMIAISQFSAAIDLVPDDPRIWFCRGLCWGRFAHSRECHAAKDPASEIGDAIDNAFTDLSTAIRLKPDFAEALVERAAIHCERRNWSEVVADCTVGVGLEPTESSFYHFRGMAYWWRGQEDLANRDLSEARRLGDEFAPSIEDLREYVEIR